MVNGYGDNIIKKNISTCLYLIINSCIFAVIRILFLLKTKRIHTTNETVADQVKR